MTHSNHQIYLSTLVNDLRAAGYPYSEAYETESGFACRIIKLNGQDVHIFAATAQELYHKTISAYTGRA